MKEIARTDERARQTIRITVDFSPEAYAVLTVLADRLGTTKANALRRSLGLFDFLMKQELDGWKMILERGAEQDKERKEILTFL